MPPGRAQTQAQRPYPGEQITAAGLSEGRDVSQQEGPRPERSQNCMTCEIKESSMPAVCDAQPGVQRLL